MNAVKTLKWAAVLSIALFQTAFGKGDITEDQKGPIRFYAHELDRLKLKVDTDWRMISLQLDGKTIGSNVLPKYPVDQYALTRKWNAILDEARARKLDVLVGTYDGHLHSIAVADAPSAQHEIARLREELARCQASAESSRSTAGLKPVTGAESTLEQVVEKAASSGR